MYREKSGPESVSDSLLTIDPHLSPRAYLCEMGQVGPDPAQGCPQEDKEGSPAQDMQQTDPEPLPMFSFVRLRE